MADNYQITEGVGKTMRSRDVSGIHHAVFFDRPDTEGGCAPFNDINVGTTGVVVKNSPGQIYGWHLFNAHATDLVYLKVYDKATAPTSSDTPKFSIPLGALGGTGFPWTKGIEFTAGIGIRASTGVAHNDTGAPATNQVVVNIGYK